MDQKQLQLVLDEHMQRYIKDPSEFEREWQTVGEFLRASRMGEEPSYGENLAAYLFSIKEEIKA